MKTLSITQFARASGLALAAPLVLGLGGAGIASAQVPPPGTNPFAGTQPAPYAGRRAPSDPLQARQQGYQQFVHGNAAQAERDFNAALEINPFDPAALNNLAVARSEQGDYHAALELLERAARLNPGNLTVAANLSRLRSWVNYYAGNEPHPIARVAVSDDAAGGGLPPEPPPLWDPSYNTSRTIVPRNQPGLANGTYYGQSYVAPASSGSLYQEGVVTTAPPTYVYDGATVDAYQQQAPAYPPQQPAVTYSVPEYRGR